MLIILSRRTAICQSVADTAYKYRMVQFGLAWKIDIIYNTTTNSNSYTKITSIRQIFLQLII